ncbi:MAG TPA: MATE family efflux transporter [Syntrophomonadaceae bacterium]|nr:MATE family efflux transporter [Syntrophomonadaceae bacterium]
MDHSKQLGEVKVARLLLKFSIPAIIAMLVNALYNVVDRIFVGNSVGPLGIAGITIGFPIMLIMMAFGMLIGLGANSLVSIKLGEGRKDEAELILGNAMLLLIIVALLQSAAGLALLNPLLKIFGASGEVLPYARAYMQIILLGAIFQSLGFGMNNFIRGEGNPRVAMLTMLIGAALNAMLCPLFIFGLGMGIRGSALATVISQGVSAAWVLRYFFSGQSTLKIRKKNLVLQKRVVGSILALGSAPFALQMAASLVNTVMNKSLGFYGGDLAISGMGIVMSVLNLAMMPVIGINQGVQPIIGYNYGAKKYDRVKEALKLAITGATAIVCLGFVLVQVFPRQIVGLFNSSDPELLKLGVYFLRSFLIFLPLVGFQIVSSGYFQAVGKPKQSAFLTLSRQLILLVPAILILPLFFKLHGVVMAGPVADLGSSMLTGFWITREIRRLGSNGQPVYVLNKAELTD